MQNQKVNLELSKHIRVVKWEAKYNDYMKKTKLLDDEREKIKRRHVALQQKKSDLALRNGGTQVTEGDKVIVNVGGELMKVIRGTLTQIKGSTLEALFSGRWETELIRDEDHNIFLDVNPKCFKIILDYLRELKISSYGKPPQICSLDKDNELPFYYLVRGLGLGQQLSCRRIDSTIMNDLEPMHLNSLYTFLAEEDAHGHLELLYRGSRDGWRANNFHTNCDNRGATVSLIKSSGGYVFGGYSDTPWTSDGYYKTSRKAFLFSLKCCSRLGPTKLKMQSMPNTYAIYDHISYGPTFGNHDIYIADKANTNQNSYSYIGRTYTCPPVGPDFLTGARNFQVEEIEVFSVHSSIDNKSHSFLKQQHFRASSNKNAKVLEEWKTMKFDCFSTDIRLALEKEREDLITAWDEVIEMEQTFEKEKSYLNFFLNANGNDVVVLDVQGKRIATKRSTLRFCPLSALAQHFESQQSKTQSYSKKPVQKWDVDQVVAWSKRVEGLCPEVSKALSDHEVNGAELVALDREDLKYLGIKKIGTAALVLKSIEKLRNDDKQENITSIDYDAYCFGKVLDQLRVLALHGTDEPLPPIPYIRENFRRKFKNLVTYYFQSEDDASLFIKI